MSLDSNPITPTPSPGDDGIDIDKNKVFAILAYIGILFVVPLLLAPNSRFARYHANQGLVLFLTGMLVAVTVIILELVLGSIPVLNHLLILTKILYIGLLVLAVIGIVNAASGVCKPLPLVGKYQLIK